MILGRLTKIQKEEILEAYKACENTNSIAKKYGCSANTVNRTVKALLSENEYQFLKGKRLKGSQNKSDQSDDQSFESNQQDFVKLKSSNPPQDKNEEKELMESDEEFLNSEFEEIAPLTSGVDFEKKELDFEMLSQENLPESVYMIVDKKVELDLQLISNLPEWSFLPENELNRNAILLFSNQRSAKRSCSRNQRVIKIPNTSIFKLSNPYLISKGITRLILDDSLIALDD